MMRSLALSLLACCLLVDQAVAQNFTVTVTHGNAVIGKDRSSYQAAAVNSKYPIPSWGKTEDQSSITIAFTPQNVFRLLPNSEAQVTTGGESDSGSAWHRVVNLKIGQAEIDHNAGSSPTIHLDCETPTAVCGAVGTKYSVDATAGIYSVDSGRISVKSNQEGQLTLPAIAAGGSVTYNPGVENTYSKGNFSGTVVLDGSTLRAADANFTVAKLLDSSSETAVHVESGTLGGNGRGDYVMDGGKLVRVPAGSKAAGIHPQYLAAAKREGALSVERAADRAANRTFGNGAALNAAAARATDLRHQLFNRETIREVTKQVTQEVIRSATQGAAQAAASSAASAAARNASRGGH